MKKSSVFKPAAMSTLLGMSALMVMGTAYAHDDAPKSMTEDSVTLLQAIELAKTNTGGIPMEAERDVEMGQAFYEIELAGKNGESYYTVINSSTGEVILNSNHRRKHGDDHHDSDDQLENALWLSGLNSGQYQSLEDVVKQAEAELSGKAYSVEIDEHRGNYVYEVKLVTANGRTVETEINAMTVAK
ncbi:hypothetical protein BCT30_02525 [Enterovibrio norvegicus]|uniref:PepSY domain-containing protein n=1 Tax=Enterovibrio norvegicus TaxID=188144 RepID=A0A2N7LC83_9GAMM|nr:PepSY domain-containing protein [Enterovibrio norvegicus]MCC4798354.1 PepSY domain-containing protein [Enterovibrio norvegicus]PMH65358.1 hypothetical protein BCU62_13270 [Enterovibrio norvegicus]PMI33253.1 hypothetical protein BCU46_03610 [Enterovibrio norvegicus]PMI33618.1 hypothetical protein BCU47_09240 [Enterovibrio norvegicus]PMN48274.1 hypothetical protein BCT30_02525 [Enterovibrio norvegicus]